MGAGPEMSVDIPPFVFRIEPDEVVAYRAALGVAGERVPFGLALRALASGPVASALRDLAEGRHAVHVAQEYRAHRALRTGVDYVCEVRIQRAGEKRLRVLQALRDASGVVCLNLASEVALVAA